MFCPHCGKEFAPDANFCPACGKGSSYTGNPYQPTRIMRPRMHRVLAGVCAAFALHYGWDLTLTRVLFSVFSFFFIPLGFLFYIGAWIFMPDEQYALPQNTRPSAGI
jgi:phage shock protein PspC (stress-responsive transcriptional regulator)